MSPIHSWVVLLYWYWMGNRWGNDIPQEDSYGYHKLHQTLQHKMSFLNETPTTRRVINKGVKTANNTRRSVKKKSIKVHKMVTETIIYNWVLLSAYFPEQHHVFTDKGHRVPVYVKLKTAHCSFSVCPYADPSLWGPSLAQCVRQAS